MPARLDNGAITRAAAEIAGKRFVDDPVLDALAALMKCKHGHHETGRAETALGGIRVDHGLLHRMKSAVGRGEPLDRQHSATGDLR